LHKWPLFFARGSVRKVLYLPNSTDTYSGAIDVYVAKDYAGNIHFSYRIPCPRQDSGSLAVNGRITQIMFSPDGYALFVGSEVGWHLWSVYGHSLSSSFLLDRTGRQFKDQTEVTAVEGYMDGVRDCCWAWSGLSLIILANEASCFYTLPFSRSAATTCYNPVSQAVSAFSQVGYDNTASLAN
jgi:hypothetical protein